MITKKYGLIGYPLSHSFSPRYFAGKFEELNITDSEYKAYAIPKIDEVQTLLDGQMKGLNVTIPYKEQVMPFLDSISEEAQAIGAVNTIKIYDNGTSKGFNTDVYGFTKSVEEWIGTTWPTNALILGTGGASKAVAYSLMKKNVNYKFVSRSRGDVLYSDLDADLISNSKLIINTSPLGMYPNVTTKPDIPYEYLTPQHCLYDLVYNPEVTAFLATGNTYDAKTKSGHDMLIYQAEKSWEIWTDQKY